MPPRRAASAIALLLVTIATTAHGAGGPVLGWGRGLAPPAVNGVGGTATFVAVGPRHACAIQAITRAVVCWPLPRGVGTDIAPPDSVNGTIGGAYAVAVGGAVHSCAIRQDTGAVVCWGSDFPGGAVPPPSVDGTTGTAAKIAVGSAFACAIAVADGAVVCWGDIAAPLS